MTPPQKPQYLTMFDRVVSKVEDKILEKVSAELGIEGSGASGTNVGTTAKVNAVYYPSWRIYRGEKPSGLNVQKITHVFYAFLRVKEDGSIIYLDEHADLHIDVDGTKGCLEAIRQLKTQHPHIRTVLSIGGGSGSKPFPALACRPESREHFARCARELVDRHGADGIDIDWEHPQDAQQGRDFILLLEAIRRQLPSPYLLTTALPAGPWVLQHIDLNRGQRLLDYLNLMTYDFAGPWTPESGHQSQLYTPKHPHCPAAQRSCQSGVDYLLGRGFPASRILLGIPVYGRAFTGTCRPGEKHCCDGEVTYEYKELPRPGCVEKVDREVMGAYCVDGKDGFISYDNVETVGMKARFVGERRLGGLFYWTGTGDKTGEESLVEVGWRGLNGR